MPVAKKLMRILAIPRSLRAASINRAFCHACARLAPSWCRIDVESALGDLRLYNPDRESEPPDAVVAFRDRIAAVDALLIASPEYAHGVSGVMKNALDWLVSFEGFVGKRVAVVNNSPRAPLAYEALLETVRTIA